MSDELLSLWQSVDETPTDREDYIRSPMPYAGSKFRELNQLLPLLPYDKVWVDAFGGTGSVTLNRNPSPLEVFNDRHAGITSFYRCLQNPIKREQLFERIELTIHSREDFIWCKETWKHDALDDVERAARWYYVQNYSFGGVGRNFGRSLDPIATLSGRIKQKLPLFMPIHLRFEKVQIENADWRTLFRDYDSDNTVWYLDPPYYGIHVFEHEMTKADHIEMCEKIFRLKGFVALSGFNNEIYDQFSWDDKHSWPINLTVTSRATKTDTSNVTQLGKGQKIDNLWIKDYG